MKSSGKHLRAAWALTFLMALLLTDAYAWSGGNQKVTNEAMGYTARLVKYGVGTDGGRSPLAGVEFELLRRDETGEWAAVDRRWTDASGQIELDLPVGEYKFVEVKPPDGYEYDRDEDGKERKEYGFTLPTKDNGGTASITVDNPKIQSEPTPTPTPPDTTSRPKPDDDDDPKPRTTVTPTPGSEPTPTPSGEPTPTPSDEPTPPPVEPTPPPSEPVPPGVTPTPPPDIPKTGDDRRPGLWIALGLIGLVGLIGCVWYALAHRYRGKRTRR